jgi:hypothetical protein
VTGCDGWCPHDASELSDSRRLGQALPPPAAVHIPAGFGLSDSTSGQARAKECPTTESDIPFGRLIVSGHATSVPDDFRRVRHASGRPSCGEVSPPVS